MVFLETLQTHTEVYSPSGVDDHGGVLDEKGVVSQGKAELGF